MASPRYPAIAITILLALAIIPIPLLRQTIPKIPNAHASTFTTSLRGFASTGWNGSSTNKNPTITANAFDTIRITISSGDAIPHQFLLDGDRDGKIPITDCLTPDPCSNQVPPSTTYVFTVANLASGTYTYYCTIHPGTMLGSFVINPDYSVNSNPSSISIPAGNFGTSQITLNSNGFTGTVSLSSTVTPTTPTIGTSLKPSSVTLTPGGSGTSTLNVTTTPFTPLGTYNINVTGTSGALSHSTVVTVTVTSGTIGGAAPTTANSWKLPYIGLSAIFAVVAITAALFTRHMIRKRARQA